MSENNSSTKAFRQSVSDSTESLPVFDDNNIGGPWCILDELPEEAKANKHKKHSKQIKNEN